MEYVIETQGLTKKYGEQWAVDNLDLKVPKGKVYGFLGLNGAGKTTTIRMILGLIRPSQGEVKILGHKVNPRENHILRNVGSIVEFSGFYPNLSGFDNLKINALILGINKNSKIVQVLEQVGLQNDMHKQVRAYSLGMKQRLGIARAVLHNPEILILDEPANGLDPVGIKEVRSLISHLAKRKQMTIFMSSHLLHEVQQMADIIGIIHQGRLVKELHMDDLEHLTRNYLELKVSEENKTAYILEDQLGIKDFEVLDQKRIRIYSHFKQAGEINRELVTQNIEVSHLAMGRENLEEYFIKTIGVKNNEIYQS